MTKPRSKMGDAIRLSGPGRKAASLRGEKKRRELVGSKGVAIQDKRRAKAKKSKNPKALGLDVQKRMKEYRTGEADAHTVAGRKGYKK